MANPILSERFFLLRQPQSCSMCTNIGDWTISLLQDANSGVKVHAFEPSPKTFEILEKRCAGFPCVTLVPMACSDVGGTAWMAEVGPGAGTNALTTDRSLASREVLVTTIESYCHRN